MLEKLFKLSEHRTNVRTEVVAGLTTFMTMAYILAVNPGILSATGMPIGGVFTATALSALIATLVMGLTANLPVALAPGMGLNAFFAFTVVLGMGYSWQLALTAVLLEGVVFIGMSLLNIREAIIKSIPENLKKAVAVGIGLFIAFIGLQNAGIIVSDEATVVALGNITGGTGLLALIGLVLTGVLLAYRVKGALLIGILATTVIGIPFGITIIPGDFSLARLPEAPIFCKFEFQNIFTFDFFVVFFTFLFVDLFDTVGTLVGVATKAGLTDAKGDIPKVKFALLADAVGTIAGAALGTSTVTSYVESASGVAEGGRTGLTAVTTALMFGLALFLSPIFLLIPGAATAPALILVGLFMMSPIKDIDLDDYTEAIPAFLTIIMMPLAYSIAEGLIFGVVSFILLKAINGKFKDIPIVTWIVGVFFILKHIIN